MNLTLTSFLQALSLHQIQNHLCIFLQKNKSFKLNILKTKNLNKTKISESLTANYLCLVFFFTVKCINYLSSFIKSIDQLNIICPSCKRIYFNFKLLFESCNCKMYIVIACFLHFTKQKININLPCCGFIHFTWIDKKLNFVET